MINAIPQKFRAYNFILYLRMLNFIIIVIIGFKHCKVSHLGILRFLFLSITKKSLSLIFDAKISFC